MKGTQGVPKSKGLPVIGEKEKIQGQEIVQAIMMQLKPTLDIILENIDGLERRVSVVEEVKQLFPAKVDVHIKHEKPLDISEGVLDMIVTRLEKHGKVTITSEKK